MWGKQQSFGGLAGRIFEQETIAHQKKFFRVVIEELNWDDFNDVSNITRSSSVGIKYTIRK